LITMPTSRLGAGCHAAARRSGRYQRSALAWRTPYRASARKHHL